AEQAHAYRAPRNEADAEVTQRRDDFQLDRTLREIVKALFGGEPQKIARSSRQLRGGDVPAGEIAGADIGDLAFTDQLLHRLPDFLPGRCPVDVMHLVEVDVVGVQPLQTGLAGTPDMVG